MPYREPSPPPPFTLTDTLGRNLLHCASCLESNVDNPDWKVRQAVTIDAHGAVCMYHFMGRDNRYNY